MDQIEELLSRRLEKIYPDKKSLEKKLRSGKKIRLYQGFDPSKPDLHLGHLVGLLTLKQFQKLGHEVIFLVGDFTGRVGDPTGKATARQALTEKEALKNAVTYQKQASLVLPFSGPNPVKLRRNSEWLARLTFDRVLELGHYLTVQQLIERDMFQNRLKQGKEIYLTEFMYPLMQGYDSVFLQVDLEIGGSDQTFNMLAGRKLVKEILNKEKFVATTKLLTDSQGKKIGKTEGNAINLVNPPEVLYGQIMSLNDECIIPTFRLATELPLAEVREIEKKLKRENPMIYKKRLAFEIVKMLHSLKTAELAEKEFETVFQQGCRPEKIITLKTEVGERLIERLVKEKLVESNSEAKRLIEQGSIKINDQKIRQKDYCFTETDNNLIIKVGKLKFARISLT